VARKVTRSGGKVHSRTIDWAAWSAFAFGLGWYLWRVDAAVPGPSTLWPTHVAWALHPDWDQHYLGWAFFRQAPMAWPPSRLPNLGLPGIGTTVGLMDANPWLCNLLRPLSAWLPAAMQFNGPWTFVCFGLQGLCAAKLLHVAVRGAWGRALGGALMATSPVLLARIEHDTLTAQWLILLALWCVLLPVEVLRRHRLRPWAWSSAALIFTAGLHPYLLAMLAPFWVLCLVRWAGVLPDFTARRAAAWAAGTAVLLPACLYAAGFVGAGASAQEPGFGVHSANLWALVDPRGWSRLWPTLQAWPGQSEGFAFLGAGVWATLVLGCVLSCVRRPRPAAWRVWLAVYGVALAEAAFAVSDRVTWGHVLLWDLRPYTVDYQDLLNVLRASGRFVWPLHYLLALTGVAALWHALPQRAATVLLAGALGLQIWDTDSHEVAMLRLGPQVPVPNHALWRDLSGYAHLVLYPPSYQAHEGDCGMPPYTPGTYVALAQRALPFGLTLNSVSAARTPREPLRAYCSSLHAAMQAEQFADDTVYVVPVQFATPFLRSPHKVACGRADSVYLCVGLQRQTPLLAQLTAQRNGAQVP
jgi:hypothetical protein